jgi:hypothetical protein
MQKYKFLPLPGLELQPLGHPARCQSLYRVRYPGFLLYQVRVGNRRSVLPKGTHEASDDGQQAGTCCQIENCIQNIQLYTMIGRTIIQAVSRRFPTAAVHVR